MLQLDDRFWIMLQNDKKGDKVLCRLGMLKTLTDKIGPTVFIAQEVKETDFIQKGEILCVVESTKAAMDIEAPLDLEVVKVNSELDQRPHLLFDDPEKEGWLIEAWIEEKAL